MSEKRVWHCAIYTRKSSDEGLEQDFNSLHAQREACEAYIRSQAHEGWRILPHIYNDGGWSGGSLERPALQKLLIAVEAGEVDIIVIYKIDRLTRSLTDFAKLAERFDAKGVSFVSVTQQFNTTTSMGRLMLNVLLSFAQFEREVTGERIRDKIAASKKKGLWMGGTVPIGYDVKDRSLIINEEDAETIRQIFRLYLELGNVSALEEELHRRDIRTKARNYGNGRSAGSRPFSRGHLYRILSNPIYIGHVPHKEKSYPGQHQAIIDRGIWDKVQDKLAANLQGPRRRRARIKGQAPLLAGILSDDKGTLFIHAQAHKQGRRYRYYVEKMPKPGQGDSSGGGSSSAATGTAPHVNGTIAGAKRPRPKRIPALEIEAVIRRAINELIASPSRLLDLLGITRADDVARALDAAAHLHARLRDADPSSWDRAMAAVLDQVIWRTEELSVRFDRTAFLAILGVNANGDRPLDLYNDSHISEVRSAREEAAPDASAPEISIPIRVRTRGVEMKLILPGANGDVPRNPDPALIRAVARGYRWFQMLRKGDVDSIGAIAAAEGVTTSFVSRTVRLAFLGPDLMESILNGTQPPDLTADYLMIPSNIAVEWKDQKEVLPKNK